MIFINDINPCFQNSEYLLYADDLKIFRQIRSFEDTILVQQDLTRLHTYCTANKIFLAYNKCQFIRFTRQRLNVNQANYNIDGRALEQVRCIRDLGVYFDEKLTFNVHVNHIVNKAYRMLGFLMRVTKKFKKRYSFLLLHQSLVRSHLEYVSTIWNPHYKVYNKQIEMVQKKFLRAINFRLKSPKKSYQRLLSHYKMMSLHDRRLVADAAVLKNISCGTYNCPKLTVQLRFHAPRRVPRSTKQRKLFYLNKTRTNAGIRAPLYRICDNHNKLFMKSDLFCSSAQSLKRDVAKLLRDSHS